MIQLIEQQIPDSKDLKISQKNKQVNLAICTIAALCSIVYVYLQVNAFTPGPATAPQSDDVTNLAQSIAQDQKGEFDKASKSLEGYFSQKDSLLPPREVARIRFFRTTVGEPDYFDMLVSTRTAGLWPKSRIPLAVFIGDFKVFGKEADSLIRKQIASALKEWQQAVGRNLEFKVVDNSELASIRVVPERDPSFMPLQGALADTSWEDDNNLSKHVLLPKRQSATVRIIDPHIDAKPSQQKINSVRSSILHEIGHALGINGHSANAADTMFAIENASPQTFEGSEYKLSKRDKETIRRLYLPGAEAMALQRIENMAAANNPYACLTLGTLYYKGEDKPVNDKEARKWFERAADQNLPEAIGLLGEMNFSGRGQQKDYQKAFTLFKRAADLSSPEAQINMGFMYANGLGIKKDYEKSRQWYEEASKQGVATATFNLGVVYENGTGTDKDYNKAVDYYRRAASQGSTLALSALSAMYYTGRGVTRDYEKGMDLARRAAEQSADGKVKMGDLYLYGLGVETDPKKAREWYEKGVKESSPSAMLRLAGMYIWGRGVPRNIPKAIGYYKQAEEKGLDSAKQAQSNIDFDDAIGNMMRGEYSLAAPALDRFLTQARKSYYAELESNFFYAAAYDNISWRHAGNEKNASAIARLILKERTSEEWPKAAVKYLTGEISEKDLLGIAGDDLEKQTESKYFIGANESLKKNYRVARANLQWVLKEGRKDFFEYSLAERELLILDKAHPDPPQRDKTKVQDTKQTSPTIRPGHRAERDL